MQTPEQQRQAIRQKLNLIPPDEKQRLSERAVVQLINSGILDDCRTIALFFPVRHELEIHSLVEYCWKQGIQTFLPRLLPQPATDMIFQPYDKDTRLKPNRFAIPEPDLPIEQCIPACDLDIAITPLLGFGTRGQRLGMGGGFYDRAFAFKLEDNAIQRPQLWAIALDIQCLDIETRPWDVPLQGVATQTRIYTFS